VFTFHGFWATVCITVRRTLSDRCLSVMSVTLVNCGQTVRWIKMKLGMEVGISPGHIVLDRDPAPPQKEHSPNFRLLWAKRLHGATRYGDRTRPMRHYVRWGPPKRGKVAPNLGKVAPNFWPVSVVAKRPDESRLSLLLLYSFYRAVRRSVK